jgi:uncharacterized repeat protein (TIGR03803 family)
VFGTTYGGGIAGEGVAFELIRTTADKYKYEVIYNFCEFRVQRCADGANPSGPLSLDRHGNLYGLNFEGGGNGQAYELAKTGTGGWTYRVLHQFWACVSCANGEAFPWGSLTYAGAAAGLPYDEVSPLYGVTQAYNYGSGGGQSGAVFALQPEEFGWREQALYYFCSQQYCADGGRPNPTIVEDYSGNLYGAIQEGGGTNYAGAVFKLSPDSGSWTKSNLYDFCSVGNCADGQGPSTTLAIDSSGTLYGGTAGGGASCSKYQAGGCGVAYQLVASTGTESVLHKFCKTDCADGFGPGGNVAVDSQGDVFGTTWNGGDFTNESTGGGTVVRIHRGKTFVLHQFCGQTDCVDGSEPISLMRDPSGRLFGVTVAGGANNKGVVFELTP